MQIRGQRSDQNSVNRPRSGAAPSREAEAAPRPAAVLVLWGLLALAAFAGFVALGTWQVHRRAWKLDLIHRVEQRLAASPSAPPARSQWPGLSAANDEYRKLCLDGSFVDGPPTLVQAVTRLGGGDWVLAPLRTADGDIVIINRGFVAPEQRAALTTPAGTVKICGLLRLSEPRGGFLRHNDPAAGRWFSRDVAAIGAARGLPPAQLAPYFVDADDRANPGGVPVGGLTVVSFHNSHLVYIFTWYGLALLVAFGGWTVGRHEWSLRRALK